MKKFLIGLYTLSSFFYGCDELELLWGAIFLLFWLTIFLPENMRSMGSVSVVILSGAYFALHSDFLAFSSSPEGKILSPKGSIKSMLGVMSVPMLWIGRTSAIIILSVACAMVYRNILMPAGKLTQCSFTLIFFASILFLALKSALYWLWPDRTNWRLSLCKLGIAYISLFAAVSWRIDTSGNNINLCLEALASLIFLFIVMQKGSKFQEIGSENEEDSAVKRHPLSLVVFDAIIIAAALYACYVHHPDILPTSIFYQIRPSQFETVLKIFPADEELRLFALTYYSDDHFNPEKLKEHTFEMIKYHPDNQYLYYENIDEFYKDPLYLDNVTRALETQRKNGCKNASFYLTLAKVYEIAALPQITGGSDEKAKFLKDHNLPANTVLRENIDVEKENMAFDYFQKAINAAGSGAYYSDQCRMELGAFLYDAKRLNEANAIFKEAYPFNLSKYRKAYILLTYGRSLYKVGRYDEADTMLKQATAPIGDNDCVVTAYATLGLIDVAKGDLDEADKMLLASANVDYKNGDWIVPIELARKLLDAKQNKTVSSFCPLALAQNPDDRDEIQMLMKKVQTSQIKSKK